MAQTDAPADPLTELDFELERFEWTADDRLEVTGRWFGVRGQRFMRPTLHVRVEGRRRRLIAVLDHKPWAADTEELWTAAFTWRGDHAGVTGARLEVSPDVILDLPNPGAKAAGTSIAPRPRPRREPRKPPAAPRRPASPPATTAVPLSPAPAAEAPPAAEVEAAPVEVVPVAAVEQPAVEVVPPPEVVAPAEIAGPPEVAPVAEIEPPAPAPAVLPPTTPPAHAPASVAAEIAVLALERRLVEERAEREGLARDLAAARQEIEALSAHHASAVERAREIVELEGRLAVADARADAAQTRVAKLERELAGTKTKRASAAELEDALADAREELAEVRTPIEVAPLPPRTPRRRGAQEWDERTKLASIGAVGFALLVVLILLLAFG